MGNKKTIVLVGSSQESWENAVRNVVRHATQSIGKIDCVDLVHQSACTTEEGEILEFRATVQLTFDLPCEQV